MKLKQWLTLALYAAILFAVGGLVGYIVSIITYAEQH